MDTSPNLSTHPSRTDTTLDELLDAELDYDPVARAGFINHLPMGLVAARRLGATDPMLARWFEVEASHDFLVRRERPAWLPTDTDRIDRRGIGAELRDRLPKLVASPVTQFFHAMIRLDLAVDVGHPGQVAAALGNWADHPHPLPAPPAGDGARSFAEVIDRVARLDGRGDRPQWDPRPVAGSEPFAAAVSSLRVHDALLDEVAAVAVAGHTSPDDFGTLHLVTGVRAARALSRWLAPPEAAELATHTAHAVAAIRAVLGSGPLPSIVELEARRSAPLPTWDEIAAAAIGTFDPHVVKLVYACRLEADATGDRLYQAVAARQVALDGTRQAGSGS